jgi:hypothetical protein
MDLMQYLPSFYLGSAEIRNIQASIGLENEVLQKAISELMAQCYVESATWGLDHWENYLGIDLDSTESDENRRSRIMTRLRGQGTTTKEMIKNVCSSFTGVEAELIEKHADYTFIVKFVGAKGIPANLDYLENTIEAIKPAHLAFSFEFTYNTWEDLSKWTWGELESKTWGEVETV